MTPIQLRNAPLSDATCYHELGHLYVALCLGALCDINFLASADTDAGAATSWGALGSPFNRNVSCMAGAYAQAIYAPESLPDPVRRAVLNGDIFEDFIWTREVSPELNFIWNDLGQIDRQCAMQASTVDDQVVFLRSGFDRLTEIFSNPRRDSIIRALHADIAAWLNEDDQWLRSDDIMMFYNAVRSRPIYDGLKDGA
jgi:hypothetical protein